MSTSSLSLDSALAGIPGKLRTTLIKQYVDLKNAFVNGNFDACGLRAGKFCEVALRVLQELLTQQHIPIGTKIPNFADECAKLQRLPKTSGPEGLRLLLPQALCFVYSLRNKRDIGHVSADIDANEVDAATAIRCADWCLAEMVRTTHMLSIEEAQAVLDAIAERELPLVWLVGGKKRVLESKMTKREQVIILLYSEITEAVLAEDLASWVEAKRMDNFRSQVLLPLHRERYIEYDRETETIVLSPKGASEADNIRTKYQID
jgi:hypothetical protein